VFVDDADNAATDWSAIVVAQQLVKAAEALE
jgi:hypothetical protein